MRTKNTAVVIGGLALAQLALVGVGVAPQLSARATGDSYLLRVEPLDPIDPFRGAYVALAYPDLRRDESEGIGGEGLGSLDDGMPKGEVFVTLTRTGEVWVAQDYLRERPESGPYLACDDRSWQIRCGIDSLFLPQEQALAMEESLADGAYAEVRIDSRGNAAVVEVRETP